MEGGTSIVMQPQFLYDESDPIIVNNRDGPELFTSRGCCSDKEAAHEAVDIYREWAATKSMW
jgi:hypothetical protein